MTAHYSLIAAALNKKIANFGITQNWLDKERTKINRCIKQAKLSRRNDSEDSDARHIIDAFVMESMNKKEVKGKIDNLIGKFHKIQSLEQSSPLFLIMQPNGSLEKGQSSGRNRRRRKSSGKDLDYNTAQKETSQKELVAQLDSILGPIVSSPTASSSTLPSSLSSIAPLSSAVASSSSLPSSLSSVTPLSSAVASTSSAVASSSSSSAPSSPTGLSSSSTTFSSPHYPDNVSHLQGKAPDGRHITVKITWKDGKPFNWKLYFG